MECRSGAVLISSIVFYFILQLRVSEHMTTPPGYLSESELITLMEKHGIGTVSVCCIVSHSLLPSSPQDASIPVHIENICTRNYVKIDSGRKLVPTTLGIVLVHGYQKVMGTMLFGSL